jgi:hypothetical protein
MPNAYERRDEIPDVLFGKDAAHSGAPAVEEVGESSLPEGDKAISALDAALFGTSASSTPIATDGERRLLELDLTAAADIDVEPPEDDVPPTSVPVRARFGAVPGHEPPEDEAPTAPVPIPLPGIFDDQDPRVAAFEAFDERDAPLATRNNRGRRRMWLLAALALAVVIGATLGALALTRSSGSQPGVRTDSESTTTTSTTTSTTTVATTTPPIPDTSTPSPPASTPATASPRPASTTIPPLARRLDPPQTNPTPFELAPSSPASPAPVPEPTPPPTSPPPTSPPPTSSPPETTLP